MINLNNYELFQKRATLKELSKDTTDPNNTQYMTNSGKNAIDFDKVKETYESRLGLTGKHASSVDAITHTSDSIVFIEFKNGNMKNEKAKVKEKLRDSLLVFGGITDKTISYAREKIDYVLVYNEHKNPLPNQLTRDIVQESPSRTAIAKHIAQKGKEEFILFDLERFKRLYFREVHTFTETEFESFTEKLADMS